MSETPGVEFRELRSRGCLNLRGNPDDPTFLDAVSTAASVTLPTEPGNWNSGSGSSAYWLGPDEWLLIVVDGEQPSSRAAIARGGRPPTLRRGRERRLHPRQSFRRGRRQGAAEIEPVRLPSPELSAGTLRADGVRASHRAGSRRRRRQFRSRFPPQLRGLPGALDRRRSRGIRLRGASLVTTNIAVVGSTTPNQSHPSPSATASASATSSRLPTKHRPRSTEGVLWETGWLDGVSMPRKP